MSKKSNELFIYNNFSINREDDHNLVVYEEVEKEIMEGGGRGLGPGVGTGKTELKNVRIGYYSNFSSAITEIANRTSENCTDIKEILSKMKEIQTLCKSIKA